MVSVMMICSQLHAFVTRSTVILNILDGTKVSEPYADHSKYDKRLACRAPLHALARRRDVTTLFFGFSS